MLIKMSSRQMQMHDKICVLKKINEHRNILFGAFSGELTKKDKQLAWTDVMAFAQSLGVVPQQKGWEYVRDVLWQNWKKGTMAKVDNRRQTVSGGGTTAKFNEMDNIILETLGKDSPLVNSLGLPETWQSQNSSSGSIDEDSALARSLMLDIAETEEQREFCDTPINSRPSTKKGLPTKRKASSTQQNSDMDDFLEKKKKKKSTSLLEYIKLQNHKTTLEILKLEHELGLPASESTCNLVSKFGYSVVSTCEDIEVANETVVVTSENNA